MHIRCVVAAGCCLVALAACANETANRSDAIVDDLGRPISFDAPAKRVVSLAPATTELLFAIGAGDVLVGRTRWADYPPAVDKVPNVGDGLDPNVEMIAAQQPDLVVFYASTSNVQAIERLDRMGIPSVSIRMDRLRSVSHAARILGPLTGTAHSADSLAAVFDAQLDSARQTPASVGGPLTVVLTWENPPIVIGSASYLSELVELAGATNVFADIPQASATVSIEAIAERDPEVILIFGKTLLPEWATRPEWQVVDAVRRRRFARITGSEFERPTFRALEAVKGLRAALETGRR